MKWMIMLVVMLMSIGFSIADDSAMTNTQVTGSGASIMYKSVNDVVVTSGGFTPSYNANYGRQSMISLGHSALDVNDSSYSQHFNAVDYSMDAEFSDMAVVSETYGMEQQVAGINDPALAGISDIIPSYQHATTESTQTGSAGGRYSGDAIINNANLTVSARAEGNLGGVGFKKYGVAQSSFSADGSSGLNFEKKEYMKFGAYGNDTCSYEGALDFAWKDYSSPIKPVNMTLSIVGNISNATDASNVTST